MRAAFGSLSPVRLRPPYASPPNANRFNVNQGGGQFRMSLDSVLVHACDMGRAAGLSQEHSTRSAGAVRGGVGPVPALVGCRPVASQDLAAASLRELRS